jgi:hypothetical protein
VTGATSGRIDETGALMCATIGATVRTFGGINPNLISSHGWDGQSETCLSRFLVYAFDSEIRGKPDDYHPLDYLRPAGQRRPFNFTALARTAIPNLTVSTIAIPAEVAHRDRHQRKKLKTA